MMLGDWHDVEYEMNVHYGGLYDRRDGHLAEKIHCFKDGCQSQCRSPEVYSDESRT